MELAGLYGPFCTKILWFWFRMMIHGESTRKRLNYVLNILVKKKKTGKHVLYCLNVSIGYWNLKAILPFQDVNVEEFQWGFSSSAMLEGDRLCLPCGILLQNLLGTRNSCVLHVWGQTFPWSETAWSEVKSLSHVRLCHPMDCSLPGFSVRGIFQTRVLEWVAISFSRGSSQPRDRTQVSRIASRCFTLWATRETAYISVYNSIIALKVDPPHIILVLFQK